MEIPSLLREECCCSKWVWSRAGCWTTHRIPSTRRSILWRMLNPSKAVCPPSGKQQLKESFSSHVMLYAVPVPVIRVLACMICVCCTLYCTLILRSMHLEATQTQRLYGSNCCMPLQYYIIAVLHNILSSVITTAICLNCITQIIVESSIILWWKLDNTGEY